MTVKSFMLRLSVTISAHKMHPLLNVDFSQIKDAELENKIQELSKKYFQATNPEVQRQIIMILDEYKYQLSLKRSRQMDELHQKRNTDLDSLINVQ